MSCEASVVKVSGAPPKKFTRIPGKVPRKSQEIVVNLWNMAKGMCWVMICHYHVMTMSWPSCFVESSQGGNSQIDRGLWPEGFSFAFLLTLGVLMRRTLPKQILYFFVDHADGRPNHASLASPDTDWGIWFSKCHRITWGAKLQFQWQPHTLLCCSRLESVPDAPVLMDFHNGIAGFNMHHGDIRDFLMFLTKLLDPNRPRPISVCETRLWDAPEGQSGVEE